MDAYDIPVNEERVERGRHAVLTRRLAVGVFALWAHARFLRGIIDGLRWDLIWMIPCPCILLGGDVRTWSVDPRRASVVLRIGRYLLSRLPMAYPRNVRVLRVLPLPCSNYACRPIHVSLEGFSPRICFSPVASGLSGQARTLSTLVSAGSRSSCRG